MPRPRSGKPHSVHITNYYHEHSGGVKTNYDRLVASADRLERNITLIVPAESDSVEDVGRFGRIYRVAAKPAPFVDRRYRMLLPMQYLFNGSAIREILLAERPDIIEIYDNYALTFLAGMTRKGKFRALGRPMFVYFTGERFDTIFKTFVIGGRIGSWFTRNVMRNYTVPMFDAFIANSRFVAAEITDAAEPAAGAFTRFCRQFFRASEIPLADRLAVCPRGVDTEFFSPRRRSVQKRRELFERFSLPDDAVICVTSTRLSSEKNVDILPLVLNELPPRFQLFVAGAGTREGHLRGEFDRLTPGRAAMLGHLSKDDLADLYANADVFIHPNPREPFGNVGLEALASGTACVFPNSGGVLTYADEDNSRLADPSPKAMAQAIIAAVSDDAERERKTANALETARRFEAAAAIDRLFETHDRFYAGFLSRQRS